MALLPSSGLVEVVQPSELRGWTEEAAANLHKAPVTGPRKEKVYRTKPEELLTVVIAGEQPLLISLSCQEIGSTQGRQLSGLG